MSQNMTKDNHPDNTVRFSAGIVIRIVLSNDKGDGEGEGQGTTTCDTCSLARTGRGGHTKVLFQLHLFDIFGVSW